MPIMNIEFSTCTYSFTMHVLFHANVKMFDVKQKEEGKKGIAIYNY